jgi:hypothetical protein
MKDTKFSGTISPNSKPKQDDSFICPNEDNQKYDHNVNQAFEFCKPTCDEIAYNEVTAMNVPKVETLEIPVQIGAFAVAGINRERQDDEESSLPDRSLSMTQITPNKSYIAVTSARLVDDEIVQAVPIENSISKSWTKYRLVIFSMIVLVGIITLSVVLTRKAVNDPKLDSAATVLLEKLKPLLTATSRDELDIPGSVPSLALDWLLHKSNFNAYSFERQVQRFGMATFYFSTKGESWIQSNGWLINDDECTWFQKRSESVCVNGTLRVLSLESNNLNGSLPNDMGLLSSLEELVLSSNELRGSIPMEIENLPSLIILHLGNNNFENSIPTGYGKLKKNERFRH